MFSTPQTFSIVIFVMIPTVSQFGVGCYIANHITHATRGRLDMM